VKYLVLDLETVVDRALPPPPKKEDGREAFPPAPYHQVVVVGAAVLDERHQIRWLGVIGDAERDAAGAIVREAKDERGALAALVGYLCGQHNLTVVSWNGRGFDLPVIAARCLRHGIAFPWYYARRDVRYRYSPEGHLDLMDYLADHGATKSCSLDLAAKLIGMPGKMDCKGADVQAMIDAGEIEKVRAYCLSDVVQTVAIFLRVQLLRGVLDAGACAGALRGLLGVIAADPRVAGMLPLIERERLLPGPEIALVQGAA
jgi:predicted PolB exonuclease-like 3'-5' exonuclease